jgi:hypothetical protein
MGAFQIAPRFMMTILSIIAGGEAPWQSRSQPVAAKPPVASSVPW